MVTQGQKTAYRKKSNSDRQNFAPKLNINFLQLTRVLRINGYYIEITLYFKRTFISISNCYILPND